MSILIYCLLVWIALALIANIVIFVNYRKELDWRDYGYMFLYLCGGALWLYRIIHLQYENEIKKIKQHVISKFKK